MCKKTHRLVGVKPTLQGMARTSTDVVTTAGFSVRPAATPQQSQMSVDSEEKVSQMPSGG